MWVWDVQDAGDDAVRAAPSGRNFFFRDEYAAKKSRMGRERPEKDN